MSAAVKLSDIRTDGETQIRDGLRDAVVTEYAETYSETPDAMPPVTVFHDGNDYWIGDGHHRVAAAAQAGPESIAGDVREGSRREALLHAVGANAAHGLRRSSSDKRRAVMALLEDDEWARWSNSEIARVCRVPESSVRNRRKELTSQNAKSESEPRRYKTRHGTEATMNTQNIGAAAKPSPKPPSKSRPSGEPAAAAQEQEAAPPPAASKGKTGKRLKPAMGRTIAKAVVSKMSEIRWTDTERAEGYQTVRDFMTSKIGWGNEPKGDAGRVQLAIELLEGISDSGEHRNDALGRLADWLAQQQGIKQGRTAGVVHGSGADARDAALRLARGGEQ